MRARWIVMAAIAAGAGAGDAFAPAQDKTPALTARFTIKHAEVVDCVAFSPDSKTLASGCRDRKVRLWDPATGEEKRTITAFRGDTYSLAFSAHGKTLALGGEGVKVWDVEKDKELQDLNDRVAEAVAYSNDGKMLAVGYFGNDVALYESSGKRRFRIEDAHKLAVRSVAISPDGKILASGSSDGTARLWDTATGKELAPLPATTGPVWCVLFSQDGQTLVAGGYEREGGGLIKVWDVRSRKEQFAIRTPKPIYSLAYSPDDKTLASGGGHGTLKLWDTATGKELAMVEAHTEIIRSVAFSPDGKNLASASHDRTVKLWDVPAPK